MAFTESVTAFLTSWLVGTLGIYIGSELVTEGKSIIHAAVTAVLGAAVWALVTSFVDSGLGPLLALGSWILLIDLRYRGGIITSILIGLAAGVSTLGIMFALSHFGIAASSALGIPTI